VKRYQHPYSFSAQVSQISVPASTFTWLGSGTPWFTKPHRRPAQPSFPRRVGGAVLRRGAQPRRHRALGAALRRGARMGSVCRRTVRRLERGARGLRRAGRSPCRSAAPRGADGSGNRGERDRLGSPPRRRSRRATRAGSCAGFESPGEARRMRTKGAVRLTRPMADLGERFSLGA
jgi:hypothetical protein